ncbi:MAG: lipoate--protein ligase [Raoultibacter sp.]
MIKQVHFHLEAGTNPYENIALEEALLASLERDELVMYLWQNRRTVVCGRNQNPWKECRIATLEAQGGHLARRLSGGGAVFHDLGNLNFTFLARDPHFNVARQMQVISAAVAFFGLDATISGRNDIAIDGAKFSGNAFYRTKDAHYHHGTLMIAVDTAYLGRYLSPDQRKLSAKGIDSVQSRVVNLGDLCPAITIESLSAALVSALSQVYDMKAQALCPERLAGIRQQARPDFFASWEWRFGKTLAFTHRFDARFDWGGIEVQLRVEKGSIAQACVFSDALDAAFIAQLAPALSGCPYTLPALLQRLGAIVQTSPEQSTIIANCARCLQQECA